MEPLAYIAIAFQVVAAVYMLMKRREWRRLARERRALRLAVNREIR